MPIIYPGITTLFRALSCAIWFLAASAVTAAPTFEDGHQAYQDRDYSKALEILLPLAKQGDADAQETLSIMYDFGYGVRKDPVKALRWYERAALQGKPLLQHDLGVRYFRGDGIPQSYEKASMWWERAAKSGVVESQYNLGLMYAQGLGVSKDNRMAVGWYNEAAKQNHANAQYSLGIMYAFDQGVELDYGKALDFFSKAADQGVMQAQYNLAVLYENGRGTQIDIEQARKWYEAAAGQGLKQAREKLATLGSGVSPSAGSLEKYGFEQDSAADAASAARVDELTREQERAKVASLSEAVNSNIREINRLNSLASEREKKNIEVDGKINALYRQLGASRKYVSDLKSQLDSRGYDELKLKSILTTIETERDSVFSSLADKQAEADRLRGEIEALKSKASTSSSSLKQQKKSLQTQFLATIAAKDRLKQELDGAKTSISDLNKLLAARKDGEGALGELLDTVSSERDEIQRSLLAKEDETSALRDEIARLKSQVNRTESSQSTQHTLEVELNTIMAERDRLARELSVARTNTNRLNKTLNNVKQQDNLSQQEWDEVGRNYQQAVDVVAQQNKQLASLQQDRNQLVGELGSIRAQLAKSEARSQRLTGEAKNKSALLEKLSREQQSSSGKPRQLETNIDALHSELESARITIAKLRQQLDKPSAPLDIADLPGEETMQAYKHVSVSGRNLEDIQNRIFTQVYVEDWIREQDPSFYALQLIALPNEKFVKKFFDIYPLYDAQKAYFMSKKDGRNVYNIIYGVYKNQIAAQQGIENLPEDLKKKDPVIRKFETIQQYVRQRDS